jgi:hypothetical protein
MSAGKIRHIRPVSRGANSTDWRSLAPWRSHWGIEAAPSRALETADITWTSDDPHLCGNYAPIVRRPMSGTYQSSRELSREASVAPICATGLKLGDGLVWTRTLSSQRACG